MGRDGFGRYPILDLEGLRVLVQKLVDHYGEGSLNRAAKEIGIPQPTLHRFHQGLSGHASQATMMRLETAITRMDRRLQKQLLLATMSTAALKLYRRGFFAWCREREVRLIRRRGQSWGKSQGEAPRPARKRWQRSGPYADLNSTLGQARKECPDVFERFEKFARRKGVPEERIRVSVVRIIEPLAETSASAYFEPCWRDLSSRQRRQFLEAGRRREEILLRREHPQVCANLLAKGLGGPRDRSL